MNNRTRFITGLTTLLCALPAVAEPIDETRAMAADGRVLIEVVNGRINISSWERDEFRIVGEVSENADGYTLTAGGRNVSFVEEYAGDNTFFSCLFSGDCRQGRGRNPGSTYEVFVPENAVLDFDGVNMRVNIDNLHNDIQVETVNGDIDLRNSSGEIRLQTVNGTIQGDQLSGRLTFETVNGRIEVRNSEGSSATFSTVNGRINSQVDAERIEADTVNGRIEIDAGTVSDLSAEAVNGRIDISLALTEESGIDLSTFNGDITLTLPAGSAAEFDLETRGDIDNRLSEHRPESSGRYNSQQELRFSLGSSSASVEISSYGGDITLRD